METPKKNRKQRTSAIFSVIKEKPSNNKENELLKRILQKNILKLNCTRVLFYIIMFVDILHDYLFKIRGRGSIIQRIYSFYETLQIILKGIVNITEKIEFIRYIKLFNGYLHEIIPEQEFDNIFFQEYNIFYLRYILDKSEFNKPEIKKYKSDAKDLFINTGSIPQENLKLRYGRVISRHNLRQYKIKIEKFDKLFETNGYQGINFSEFLKVLIGINSLNMSQIQSLFSRLNINIVLEKKKINTVNFDRIITNDPFHIQTTEYEKKKKEFLRTGKGIYLSQFLDAQNHYPISLLYKFKNENINGNIKFNNLIENFSFNLKDKNNREVLSINAEELKLNRELLTDNIKVNYRILDIVNSYLVEKNNNGSASTISTGYRYTDLFPKFLGDFLQIIQAVNNGLYYGSGDRMSFLTLCLFESSKINGLFQSFDRNISAFSYLHIYSPYSQKRKRGGKKKKSNYKYKKMAKGKKKTKKTMKGGQDIATPHNITTGWHFASQPAPTVGSISGNVENYTFSLPTVQAGGSQKVYVKGVGYRKLRYTKTGNRYVIVHGKRKRI